MILLTIIESMLNEVKSVQKYYIFASLVNPMNILWPYNMSVFANGRN